MERVREYGAHVQEWFNNIPAWMEQTSTNIDATMGPIFRPVFKPMNDALARIPAASEPVVATEVAVMLFQVAVLLVLFLRPEYVNIDRPRRRFWYDLRLWTIVSMLPHMIIYRVFD